MLELFAESSLALWTLLVLTVLCFVDNFARYLLAVAPIPYIDYSSVEYSVLAGPAFTAFYALGGLFMALGYLERPQQIPAIEGDVSSASTHNTHGHSAHMAQTARTTHSPLPVSESEAERLENQSVSLSHTQRREGEDNAMIIIRTLRTIRDGIEKNTNKTSVLSLSTLVFSLAVFFTAFATHFYQQVLLRLAMGLSQSLITPFAAALLRERFRPAVIGAAFAIFNAGTYLAFSLSLSLGVFLYLSFGWKAGYLLFGLLGIASAVLLPLVDCVYAHKNNEEQRGTIHSKQSEQVKEKEREKEGEDRETVVTLSALHSNNEDDDEHTLIRHTHLSSLHSERDSLYTVCVEEERSPCAVNAPSSDQNVLANDAVYYEFLRGLSLWQRVCFHARHIVCEHWLRRRSGGVVVLCAATAVRLGAGFVWSAYTGPLYSSLFAQDSESSCRFSFAESLSTTATNVSVSLQESGVCGSDFPYCVHGVCSALTTNPWHNKGMDAVKLETFMSWVPIVGSALGGIVAGFISDYIVRAHTQARSRSSSSSARSRSRSSANDPLRSRTDSYDRTLSLAQHEKPSSAVLFTNAKAEAVEKEDESERETGNVVAVRALIAGVSTLIALPIVVLSFFLDYPWCFLIYIPSGLVGEVYLSQTFALITDASLIPRVLIAPSVALFNLLITVIAGNFSLLVPLFAEFVGFEGHVTITFNAAGTSDSGIEGDVSYSVQHKDARNFEYSMMYALAACYVLSGLLYLVSYRLLSKKDAQ